MKINSIKTHNFRGTPLFPVNIKTKQTDGTYKKAPAQFVELDCHDENDCKLIQKINKQWKPIDIFSDYASNICKNFLKSKETCLNKRFFAIQLNNPLKDIFSNTVALMETCSKEKLPQSYLEINFLQSATALIPVFCPINVKGAGEQLIYGAIKLAQLNGADKIIVFSTNDDFYEKIGFEKTEELGTGTYFTIFRRNFDEFIKKIEKKYEQ